MNNETKFKKWLNESESKLKNHQKFKMATNKVCSYCSGKGFVYIAAPTNSNEYRVYLDNLYNSRMMGFEKPSAPIVPVTCNHCQGIKEREE